MAFPNTQKIFFLLLRAIFYFLFFVDVSVNSIFDIASSTAAMNVSPRAATHGVIVVGFIESHFNLSPLVRSWTVVDRCVPRLISIAISFSVA